MDADWAALGDKAPTTLGRARLLAQCAAYWPARAAKANLDGGDASDRGELTWDADHAIFFSPPMAGTDGQVRVGLRMRNLALVIQRDNYLLDTFELAGRRDSVVGVWLDSALRTLGLQPASAIRLPYGMPAHAVARGGTYNCTGEVEALARLGDWFGVAASMIGEVLTENESQFRGVEPLLCRPRHLDLSCRLVIEGSALHARCIEIGFCAGDEIYSQPYFRVAPHPVPHGASLPAPPNHVNWNIHGHLGAVATAEAILLCDAPAVGLRSYFDFALGACVSLLGGLEDKNKVLAQVGDGERNGFEPSGSACAA